jgi:uncharacterized membrane protein YfcA
MIPLVLSAFLAGFVDAVAGGGGLVQLPALFIFLPPALAANIPAVLGTNKLAAICGTSVAAAQYALKTPMNWRIVAPAGICAFAGSFLGARAISLLDPEMIRPVILALLVVVAIYSFTNKGFGQKQGLKLGEAARSWAAAGVGLSIGFYDGFFGPGTGSFLIFAFVGLFGFDFLLASASAKFVNFTTNIAAVSWFAGTGRIFYEYALPMAVANIAGAALGAKLAILKGNQFVRRFFLGMVLLLISRFAWEMIGG